MAIVSDPEIRAQEEALDWQRQEREYEEMARKREHEYRLAKLKLQTKENKKIWMTIVRLPLTIAALWAITILTLFRRPVPTVLESLLGE